MSSRYVPLVERWWMTRGSVLARRCASKPGSARGATSVRWGPPQLWPSSLERAAAAHSAFSQASSWRVAWLSSLLRLFFAGMFLEGALRWNFSDRCFGSHQLQLPKGVAGIGRTQHCELRVGISRTGRPWDMRLAS
jgi:hypothetical protein